MGCCGHVKHTNCRLRHEGLVDRPVRTYTVASGGARPVGDVFAAPHAFIHPFILEIVIN